MLNLIPDDTFVHVSKVAGGGDRHGVGHAGPLRATLLLLICTAGLWVG